MSMSWKSVLKLIFRMVKSFLSSLIKILIQNINSEFILFKFIFVPSSLYKQNTSELWERKNTVLENKMLR